MASVPSSKKTLLRVVAILVLVVGVGIDIQSGWRASRRNPVCTAYLTYRTALRTALWTSGGSNYDVTPILADAQMVRQAAAASGYSDIQAAAANLTDLGSPSVGDSSRLYLDAVCKKAS